MRVSKAKEDGGGGPGGGVMEVNGANRNVGRKRPFFVDKKLSGKMNRTEAKFGDAEKKAASASLLLTEEAGGLETEGVEETYKYKQRDLRRNVGSNARASAFKLSLDGGPHCCGFTRNGRYLALGGRGGRLSLLDCLRFDLKMEIDAGSNVHDVAFLHNETLLATAQQKYVYIYDNRGAEVHCLRSHLKPRALQFLPYHFLLASIGQGGYLKYQDVSTGGLISQHRTKLGCCSVLSQNPASAVLYAGHSNGVVTLWSPAMSKPLVSMFTHPSPVTAVAIDPSGTLMVTCGGDGQARVWDLRTFKELHAYFCKRPSVTASISQLGLVALGGGAHVTIWKDALRSKAKMPYLEHTFDDGSSVCRTAFRPFEDILGVGHVHGFESLIVPGSGEPNYDALEANPFSQLRQRREAEVRSLLDKMQPETIALQGDSVVGGVDGSSKELLKEQAALSASADRRTGKTTSSITKKKKTRGRSKVRKLKSKKQDNIRTLQRDKLRQKFDDERGVQHLDSVAKTQLKGVEKSPTYSALDRFLK